MNMFKHFLRIIAIKYKQSQHYWECKLCRQLIVPREKFFFVNRWAKDKKIIGICYCTNCIGSKHEVLNQIAIDSIPYGIAKVDDYYGDKKEEYATYLKS